MPRRPAPTVDDFLALRDRYVGDLCAPLADYLFARDPGRREITTYRVDRILDFTVTDQKFTRVPHIEWEDYIRADLFARQELAFNLRMRFRGRAAREVKRDKARFR